MTPLRQETVAARGTRFAARGVALAYRSQSRTRRNRGRGCKRGLWEGKKRIIDDYSAIHRVSPLKAKTIMLVETTVLAETAAPGPVGRPFAEMITVRRAC